MTKMSKDFKIVKPGHLSSKLIDGHKERSFRLSELKIIRKTVSKNGDIVRVKLCKWCNIEEAIGRRHYCSYECQKSAEIWCAPQSLGFSYHYERQEKKCNICGYDWGEKGMLDENRNPEVDHVAPIAAGGMALGVDNHQVICKACHKEKTKNDKKEIAKWKKQGK